MTSAPAWTRRGSALPLALGILVLTAGMIAVSTTRGAAVLTEVSKSRYRETALAAVDAVLARHELAVITMAEAGDPVEFAKWSNNYGTEVFGSCEVRWKVEPVRSAPRDGTGNQIPFISNPPPDISTTTPTTGIKDGAGHSLTATDGNGKPYWTTNDTVYLFRLSAEATVLSGTINDNVDWATQPGISLARAQGARYVAVNKEPLFRYVIFYAQQGPKGDLELSHGPGINIQGNVHSNGAIYIGADALPASKWDAVRRAPDSTHAYETQLGPDAYSSTLTYNKGARVSVASGTGKTYYEYINATAASGKDPASQTSYWKKLDDGRVKVTGVEGVFRLCKPAMYSRFNGFPMDTNTFLTWTQPSGTTPGISEYRMTGTSPSDGYDGSGSAISDWTHGGGWVNPYRVTDASKLYTRPVDDNETDNGRRINGNPIIGGGTSGNDARDDGRTDSWTTTSPGDPPKGFSAFVKTQATGGRVKKLPDTLSSRPLEAQKLFYPDLYVLNKAKLGQSITADDKAQPQINHILGSLAQDTVLSMGTVSLQSFFNANRERGDAHDLAAPVFFKGGDPWATGHPYHSGDRVLVGSTLYQASADHTADATNAPTGSAPKWTQTTGAETSVWNDVKNQSNILESPGQYVRYAIDGTGTTTVYMRRRLDSAQGFIGWDFVDGSLSAITQPAKSGLIIRERPVPDFNYWGSNPSGSSNPYFPDKTTATTTFTPFAYGKQKDTQVWPFTEMWVSNQGTSYVNPSAVPTTTGLATPTTPAVGGTGAANAFVPTSSLVTTSTALQTYKVDPDNGGILQITAAASRGTTSKISVGSNVPNQSTSADGNGYFTDNWRLIHLKRNNITDAGTPRAKMSTPDDTYFTKSDVALVQTRLMPDASGNFIGGSSTSDQRLAGLMIRPVTADASLNDDMDLKANGLNGRTPFAAILFSPRRGIVVQRRVTAAKTLIVVPPSTAYRAYTGINDGGASENAQLGCQTADPGIAANQVVGQKGSVVPLTEPTWGTTVYSYTTPVTRNPTTGYTAGSLSSSGTSFSVVLTKPGESSNSQTFNFVRGPWVKSQTFTASKSQTNYKAMQILTNGSDGYLQLQIKTGNTTKTTFKTSMVGISTSSGNVTWGTNTWSTGWDGRAFWLNPVWGNGYGAAPTSAGQAIAGYPAIPGSSATSGMVSDDTLRFNYAVSLNSNGSVTALSSTSTPKNTDLGVAAGTYILTNQKKNATAYSKTVTSSSSDSAATLYETGDYAAAVTFMGSWDNLQTKLSGITGHTAVPSVSDPTAPTDSDYTAVPATPSAPTPSHPATGSQTQPPDFGTTTFRIAITRESGTASSNQSRSIEINSWISARGTWAPTPGGTTSDDFVRFQPTGSSFNTADRITSGADESAVPTLDATCVGTSESLRPDYWSGSTKSSPSWTNMYDPSDTTYGSIVPGTTGYTAPSPDYLNTGASSVDQKLWEDTQIPYWTSSSASYLSEDPNTSRRASLVIYNGVLYVCKTSHTASSTKTPSGASTYWNVATHVWMRIAKSGDTLTFQYFVGLSAPASEWQWRTVNQAFTRTSDLMADDASPSNYSTVDTGSWSNRWIIGPALQSGSSSNTSTAIFSNLKVALTTNHTVDYNDWDATVTTINQVTPNDGSKLAGRTVNNNTKYLCSQYQVFWGPTEITEDFFSWTNGSGKDTDRVANELWFYNPREFWSQSAWWNEGDLDLDAWTAIPRSSWLYKETGTTTAPAAYPTNSTAAATWIEWAGRTTALNISIANLQTYIAARTLKDATYKWSADSTTANDTATLVSKFTGLIYAARTNRYPRNPYPGQDNPWNPDLPNDSTTTVSLKDLWNDAKTTGTGPATRDRLMPQINASNRSTVAPPLAAPIRSCDFHHGVMISDASAVNWGYSSTKVFGESKTSIVTPNQLYLKGDVNNTAYTVKETASSSVTRVSYTPMAVMGDSVTLLSNNWKADTSASYGFCRPGLAVNTYGVSTWNSSSLSDLSGPAAADTSYRTCILTNNQPTTRYRAFQDEGAPFVNTMLFLEDWSGRTMNFTGSLVVLDSCRYTGSFLLQNARTAGRSPFGLMGFHSDNSWSSLTGWTAAAGTPDWCKNTSNVRQPPAGTANSTTAPYGAMPVYNPPSRNMTFNTDLLSEQGTPPNTPFGVTAAGVAGWSRVLQ